MNQDITTLNVKQLLPWLRQARKPLTTAVIVILLGYTGYQISQITNVQPSQAYITAQEKTTKVPNLRANQQVISQIQQLQEPGSTTIQVTTGKQDPFTLN